MLSDRRLNPKMEPQPGMQAPWEGTSKIGLNVLSYHLVINAIVSLMSMALWYHAIAGAVCYFRHSNYSCGAAMALFKEQMPNCSRMQQPLRVDASRRNWRNIPTTGFWLSVSSLSLAHIVGRNAGKGVPRARFRVQREHSTARGWQQGRTRHGYPCGFFLTGRQS